MIRQSQHHNIMYKIWRILYPVGIHFLALLIINFIGMILLVFTLDFNSVSLVDDLLALAYEWSVSFTAIGAVITSPILILFYVKDSKRNEVVRKQPGVKNTAVDWILVFICAAGAGLGLNNLLSLSGIAELSPAFQEVSEALYSGGILVEIMGLAVVVPIAEELVFRALVYNRAKCYWGRKAALMITSLGFGLYHMNIPQGIFAFLLSVLFILLYEKMGSILVPVLCHVAVNLSSVILTEVPVFEELYESLSFVLVVTAVLICVSAITYFVIKRRKDRQMMEIA